MKTSHFLRNLAQLGLLLVTLMPMAVLANISVTKSYSPSSITAGSNSTLTITINNNPPPGGPGTLSFTDTYPSGIVNTSSSPSGACSNGTPNGTRSATSGGNSFSLSGETSLSGNHACAYSVTVTACSAGTYTDNVQVFASATNDPTSANASLTVTGSATTASASLSTVDTSAATVLADGTTTATITVTVKTACNTAASGKVVTLTKSSGSSTITAVSATTNASGVATFTVKDAVAEGPITYTASVAAESVTITDTAAVTFTALAAPTISKSFSPASIATGASSVLSITISNGNAGTIFGLAFTDSFPSGLVVASTPSASNTCGGTSSPTAGATSLSLSGGSVAGGSSCTVSVNVTSSTANSYTNNTGPVTSSNASSGVSASAVLTVVSSVASFNAIATTATDPANGHLYTRIAGTAFTFHLIALNSSNAIATGFTGTVAVDLVDNSSGGACAGLSQIANIGNQTFISGDAGRHALSPSVTVNSAYPNVKVRVIYSSGSTITACSSDAFAIRPSGFTLSSTSANADSTGSNASATPIIKAGNTFTLTATTTAGYNGTPKIDSIKAQAHSGAVVNGTVAGTFAAANSGTGVATANATYTEAGYFRFSAQGVYDDGFTVVDQSSDCTADFSNSLVSDKVGCNFATTGNSVYFGRFTPHHFDVSVTPACGLFTYSAQPFSVTVLARDSAGSTTQNYQGSYAKLVTLSNAGVTTGFSDNTVIATGFSSGEATNTTVKYTFPAVLTPATLTVRGTDADAVDSSAGIEGSTAVRAGRLHLINAIGSGQTNLPMPIRVESWQNIGTVLSPIYAWDTETDDTCTVLATTDFTITGAATTASAVSLTAGSGALTLSPPGAAGAADITGNISSLAPWLQFDWNGDSTRDNPSARAGFEINPGNRRQIYSREVIGQ